MTYTALFEFKGVLKLGELLLHRLPNEVADDGAGGMPRILEGVPLQDHRLKPRGRSVIW